MVVSLCCHWPLDTALPRVQRLTVSLRYSARISPSEAQMVASALAVAVATTRCALPAFTQLDNGARTNYRGCAVAAGMHTAFTSVSMSTVPRAYANLSGLIALFRSKLPGIDRHERVAIGAKFTYTLPNWFDDWMPPVAPTESSDIYGVAPQKALPVGALTDSIAEIRLFTVWPAFRENAVQDHAAYSVCSMRQIEGRVLWLRALTLHCDMAGTRSKSGTELVAPGTDAGARRRGAAIHNTSRVCPTSGLPGIVGRTSRWGRLGRGCVNRGAGAANEK